ncbi:MAG: ABC transporter ATP-binding protein [Clostridia bacterium]
MKAENINKKIKSNEIITDFNYTFEKSNVYGIVGRNGCGKSILLKILTHYIEPTSGKVVYTPEEKYTCFLDENCFIGEETAFVNLYKIFKYIDKKKANRKCIEDVLRQVGLIDYIDIRVEKYSKGMKQKLSLAKCLLEDANIYILDEPFNGIDIKSKKDIIEILLKNKEDKIIIITTHRIEEINYFCDRLIMLENGKIISDAVNENKIYTENNDALDEEEAKEEDEIEEKILIKSKKIMKVLKIAILLISIILIIFFAVKVTNLLSIRSKAIKQYNNGEYEKAYHTIIKIPYSFKDKKALKIYQIMSLFMRDDTEALDEIYRQVKTKEEKEVFKDFNSYIEKYGDNIEYIIY